LKNAYILPAFSDQRLRMSDQLWW